jgi:hypothetical protein
MKTIALINLMLLNLAVGILLLLAARRPAKPPAVPEPVWSYTLHTPRGHVDFLWDQKVGGFRQVIATDLLDAPGGVEKNPKP